MYKSTFAVEHGIKMFLFCCTLKAGREHPERTVLCDDFVLFSVLSLEGIKIFQHCRQLKTTGAGKEVSIFIFLPLSPLHLLLDTSMGTGLCDPPISRSHRGETTVLGRCTELTENTPGLSQVPQTNHLIVFKSRVYLFSI